MCNSSNVANFFVEFARHSEEDYMTHLKLQKLLYFAQGLHLAKTGQPLFPEVIEAWKFGPVVRSIYQKYNHFGASPISCVDEDYSRDLFTEEEVETLLDVAREYGKHTASYLVDKTHINGSPWQRAFDNGHEVVPNAEIREYFINIEAVPSFSSIIQSKELTFAGYRDFDNNFVLPLEESEEQDEWNEYNEL